MEETVAETIERMLDACVLNQIDADAQHTHKSETTNLETKPR
jgi:hypothetical protein